MFKYIKKIIIILCISLFITCQVGNIKAQANPLAIPVVGGILLLVGTGALVVVACSLAGEMDISIPSGYHDTFANTLERAIIENPQIVVGMSYKIVEGKIWLENVTNSFLDKIKSVANDLFNSDKKENISIANTWTYYNSSHGSMKAFAFPWVKGDGIFNFTVSEPTGITIFEGNSAWQGGPLTHSDSTSVYGSWFTDTSISINSSVGGFWYNDNKIYRMTNLNNKYNGSPILFDKNEIGLYQYVAVPVKYLVEYDTSICVDYPLVDVPDNSISSIFGSQEVGRDIGVDLIPALDLPIDTPSTVYDEYISNRSSALERYGEIVPPYAPAYDDAGNVLPYSRPVENTGVDVKNDSIPLNPPVTDDLEKNGILEWLKSLLESLFKFLEDLLSKLIGLLESLLTKLFVPTLEGVDTLENGLKDKMNLLQFDDIFNNNYTSEIVDDIYITIFNKRVCIVKVSMFEEFREVFNMGIYATVLFLLVVFNYNQVYKLIRGSSNFDGKKIQGGN